MIIQKLNGIIRLQGDLIPFESKQVDLTPVPGSNLALRIGKTKSGTLLCHVLSDKKIDENGMTVKSKNHGVKHFHLGQTPKSVSNVEIAPNMFYSILNDYEGDTYEIPDASATPQTTTNPFA